MQNRPAPDSAGPSSARIVWRAFRRLLQAMRHPNEVRLAPGEKILLLGSAAVERIELAYQDLLKEFKPSEITVLVYSAEDIELFHSRLPGVEVQSVLQPAGGLSLTGELDRLYRLNYPLAVLVLGGGGRFSRIRIIGTLSGSRLLRIYDENIRWVNFNFQSLDEPWESVFIAGVQNIFRYLARPLNWLGSGLGVLVMLLRNIPRILRGSKSR